MIALSASAPGVPLAAVIPLDEDTLDRLAALTRFWAGLRRPPAPPDDRVTPQRRRRLQQMLRVIDARQAGETYRAIAQTLFPKHRIDPASWAGDALRETIIRLARDGFKLVDGGYRTILRRPRRS
uniref:T6SS Transcription factor RovC-like DNA binding domain-containing protein n=1 Tax=Caulobacter sp. (strain K31) TaxID=366602 RepID=B0SV51_CAUSK